MKQLHIARNLLNSLMLAEILTACSNDQTIAPTENVGVVGGDKNTRVSAAVRLVKDGNFVFQYIKNGKLSGKISKVTGSDYRIEYTYDNSNPAGDLWITKKIYGMPGNWLKTELKYQVINGICVASENVTYGDSYQYKYSAHNLLDEVTITNSVSDKIETRKYFYAPSGATDGFRLYKIKTNITESGKIVSEKERTITYTPTPDKYPLNPGYTELDQHLPIFGKFSDLLPKDVYETGVTDNILHQSLEKNTYSTDANGLVTSRTTEYINEYFPSGITYNSILKYSTNWQGI